MNWIYYQIAMYYLRKARKTSAYDLAKWLEYSAKSLKWISRVKP